MKRFKLLSLLTVFTLVVAPVAMMTQKVKALPLTTVAVALTNDNVSATDNIVLTFTPNTAITTGTILEITYDTAFTGGAALTDADIAVTGTNITASAESNFAAGYFRSTLTTSASVTTTVTVTIDGTNELTNPATNGNYSWSVTANIGGTGTTYDTGAGLAYVDDENDILVTAIVPPTIDMELYQVGSDSELVDPNTCALGVLSLNAVNTCTYDIGFGTNTAAGVTIQVVRDGVMDDGLGNDINACAGTNCDSLGAAAVSAGFEEYGFRISDIGTGCTATAAGAFATAHQAVPATATTFITSAAVCNGTTAGQTAKRSEVTHAASMDTSTVVGTYNQMVTYTAFTN